MDVALQTSTKALNAQHLPFSSNSSHPSRMPRSSTPGSAEPPSLPPGPSSRLLSRARSPIRTFGVILRKVFEALNSKALPHARLCLMHPDTHDWSAEDHHACFVVAVVKDSLLEELWTDDGWNNAREKIIQGIFEVLIYLKATMGVGSMGAEKFHPAED